MIRQILFPKITVRIHVGFFTGGQEALIFFTVTNLSKGEIEITHTWFGNRQTKVQFANSNRPLPKRLRPMETWETWLPFAGIVFAITKKWWKLGRVRISGGEIYKSKWDKTVPPSGGLPGGLPQMPPTPIPTPEVTA